MPPGTSTNYLRELQATYDDFAAAGAIILPQPVTRHNSSGSLATPESSAA
jgi:hypothetical protein